jgi:hypothetical protein
MHSNATSLRESFHLLHLASIFPDPAGRSADENPFA